MDVDVNIAGKELFPLQVDDLHLRKTVIALNAVVNAGHLVTDDQHVLFAKRSGGVDLSVFQQLDHKGVLRFCYKSGTCD